MDNLTKFNNYDEFEVEKSTLMYPNVSYIKSNNKCLYLNEEPPLEGIRILGIDNQLYKKEQWSSKNTALGIYVSDMIHEPFYISLIDAPELMSWEPIIPSGELPTYPVDAEFSIIDTEENSKKNWSDNTYNILKVYSDYIETDINFAAKYCNNQIYTCNGNIQRNGFLGSTGQWWYIYNNLSEINSCLTLVNGSPINDRASYWTSATINNSPEFKKNYSWFISIVPSYMYGGLKTSLRSSYNSVRPFFYYHPIITN